MTMTGLLRLLLAILAVWAANEGSFRAAADVVETANIDITNRIAQSLVENVVDKTSSQCSKVKRIFGVAYDQIQGEKEPDLNKLTLEFNDDSVRIIYNITTAAEEIPRTRSFNPQHKLIIFVHGFIDDPNLFSFRPISDALLSTGECNVLALDGSPLIRWLYLRSSTYVRFMGEKLGEVLAALVKSGVEPSKMHIIGHSLGAHISGFAGKTFANLTGQPIGRISGLDPAGPCFSHVDDELRLKATDAAFVDVMHTDAGVYGLRDPVGNADFYVNGGSEQPNCLLQTCSHSRAWVYYAESVLTPKVFPAVKCKDWDAFKKGQCEKEISYMGYPCEPTARGLYYLRTGDRSPYGLGMLGTVYPRDGGVMENIQSVINKLPRLI